MLFYRFKMIKGDHISLDKNGHRVASQNHQIKTSPYVDTENSSDEYKYT